MQELRWFYRNFDLYCSLLMWRVVLLSRTHLLIDLGTLGPSEVSCCVVYASSTR